MQIQKLGCFEPWPLEQLSAKGHGNWLLFRRIVFDINLAGGDLAKIDGKVLAEAAKQGDELALKILDEEAYYLGIGIANLLNIFNPEVIILGGGVMNSWEHFKDKMLETLKEYAFESAYNSVEIRKAALGCKIGARGAIAVAMGG